jgi:VCBS repeat-containing protein
MTVTPSNQPPVARNDAYNMGLLDLILTVPAPGVLANDTDPDGDALTAAVVTGPSHGTLVFNASGSLVYTPSPSLSSFTDTFTYRANDGAANSNIATVTIRVTRGL